MSLELALFFSTSALMNRKIFAVRETDLIFRLLDTSVFKWKLKSYGCCRLWCIKTEEVIEVINTQEGGREALFKGWSSCLIPLSLLNSVFFRFHSYMKARMSRFPDDHGLGNIIRIELGKQLSVYCCDQLRKEFSRVRRHCHELC